MFIGGIVAMLIMLAVLAHIANKAVAKVMRRQEGLCAECGYDMRNTVGNRCPECGADTSTSQQVNK